MLDFGGSWENYLTWVEFSYNNSYQASIQMAPFEALNGRECRPPIGWFEAGEVKLLESNLVRVFRESLLAAQRRWNDYMDHRRRELKFLVGDQVFLKISLMKGVMRKSEVYRTLRDS